MSRDPVTEEDLDELTLGPHPPQVRAEILRGWAEDPHPDDALTSADLLTAASAEWTLAGDPARALELARLAVAAGPWKESDPRACLLVALLQVGQAEEAAELERAMRRQLPTRGYDFLHIAETYEDRGDLRTAARWLSIGLERATDPVRDFLAPARFRVRRSASLPLDGIDEETLEEFPEVARWLDDPGA